MKKGLLLMATLLAVSIVNAQTVLFKIDGDGAVPSGGVCTVAESTPDNAYLMLWVTAADGSSNYAANTGSNRCVGSATLKGKSGLLIRSQYMTSGCWYIGNISTKGYSGISISAWHSGAFPTTGDGPAKNWKLQYCIGDISSDASIQWIDAVAYSIDATTSATDATKPDPSGSGAIWTQSAFTFPATCDNQESICLRWANTSDGIGAPSTYGGKSGGTANQNAWVWIDEIVMTAASVTTDVKQLNNETYTVTSKEKNILISGVTGNYEVISLTGLTVASGKVTNSTAIATNNAGIYLVKVTTANGVVIKKVVVN